MKATDRRRFNGRKPGTMSDKERADKAEHAYMSWLDPEIRQKRIEGNRRAAARRWHGREAAE